MNSSHHSEIEPTGYVPVPDGFVSHSRLERVLRSGRFAVTAELNPPDSADPEDVFQAAQPLGEVADAINATDASGANCHMSSMGICSILSRVGLGTVLQISCRDRNRIAIQGDVLGAAAMGVGNILCLTGDGQAHGAFAMVPGIPDAAIDPVDGAVSPLQRFDMIGAGADIDNGRHARAPSGNT